MKRLDGIRTKAKQVLLLVLLGTPMFFGVCATSRPAATSPQDLPLAFASDLIASCVVRGDDCILNLENRTERPIEYCLWKRPLPVYSAMFLRFPDGQVKKCFGAEMESVLDIVGDEQKLRLDAHSVETLTLPLVSLWRLHKPGLAVGSEKSYDVDDLRAANVQFKIRVFVSLSEEKNQFITCETDWQSF